MTIPDPAVRLNWRRTLNRHWGEGPKVLRDAGVPCGKLLPEPGAVAVLKSLFRENHIAKPVLTKGRVSASQRERVNQDAKVLNDWGLLVGELVKEYCQRCHRTTLARAARGAKATATDDEATDDLPLKLPPHTDRNSTVTIYRVEFPRQTASASTPASAANNTFSFARTPRIEEARSRSPAPSITPAN